MAADCPLTSGHCVPISLLREYGAEYLVSCRRRRAERESTDSAVRVPEKDVSRPRGLRQPVANRAALLLAVTAWASSSAGEFVHPLDVVVDAEGTVYVADRRLPGVWRSTKTGFEPFVVGAKRFREPLNAVRCIALDGDGRLLVGDSATREVYRIGSKGHVVGLTSKPSEPGAIGIPNDIAVDSNGVIHVADLESHRIWRVPARGGKPEEFASVRGPRGLDFDEDGRLWVVCHGEDQVLRFTPDGRSEVVVAGRPFRFPNDIVVVGETAYVTDGYAKSVLAVRTGERPNVLRKGGPLSNPVGLTARKDGLIVVDSRARRLFRVGFDGTIGDAEEPVGPDDATEHTTE